MSIVRERKFAVQTRILRTRATNEAACESGYRDASESDAVRCASSAAAAERTKK